MVVLRLFCLLGAMVPLSACHADIAGLVFSTDLNERLGDKNLFHFLSEEDRNISLPDAYSFIVLTDTHITEDTRGLEHIGDIIEDTDKFIVVVGDITDNGDRAYLQKFVDIFGNLDIPCYPVIGNHDIFFGNWLNWKELIGSTCYRAGEEAGSTEIIVLDSATAFFGAQQLDWLKARLETPVTHRFIFTHIALFVDETTGADPLTNWRDVRERTKFVKMVDGSCEAVFMGHNHQRSERTIHGVRYITLEDFASHKTFMRVRVSPDGLNYEIRDYP